MSFCGKFGDMLPRKILVIRVSESGPIPVLSNQYVLWCSHSETRNTNNLWLLLSKMQVLNKKAGFSTVAAGQRVLTFLKTRAGVTWGEYVIS